MIHGLIPSLATAGNIKTGGKGPERTSGRGNKFRPPEKWDHFKITGTERDENGDLAVNQPVMDALAAADYADKDGKVRTLPVVLHADSIEDVFPHYYAAYTGKRLACRGDGRAGELRELKGGVATGATKAVECPCERLESKRCKPHGILHCSLRLPDQAVAGAVYRWRTTSIISLQQMVGSLTQILATVGILQGLPLMMRVQPITVSPGGHTSTVYCCHLALYATSLNEVQQQALAWAQQRNALQGNLEGAQLQYSRMLQSPGDEGNAEAGHVQDEFYSQPEPEPPRPAADLSDAELARAYERGDVVDPPAEPVAPVPPARPVVPAEPDSPPETTPSSTDGPGPRPPGGSTPQANRRRGTCPVCGDGFYPEDRAPGAGMMCKWCAAEPPVEPADEPPAAEAPMLTIIEQIKAEIARGTEAGLLEPTIRAAMQRDGIPLDDPLELRDRHPGMAYMVIEHLLAEMAASKP